MLRGLPGLVERRRRSERGFTAIEIIVTLAVLAIIIVPLSMTVTTTLKVTDQVGSQISASVSRDQLASYWTKDVQSVDAVGVTTDPAASCTTTAAPATGESLLISFNSTNSTGSGQVITRNSWWVTGAGVEISLVRRSCRGVTVGVKSTAGSEVEVATAIGVSGGAQTGTVQGPSGAGTNPCDEFSCTVKVSGRYNYQVTAQRRVFGAGVPLEVGKLYSTSGVKFAHYSSLNGSGTGTEQTWPGALSLAGGLESDTVLTVQFKIQSNFSGDVKYLSNYITGTWVTDATDNTWVDGKYDTTTKIWTLPMTAASIPKAGEYKVWTKLSPVSGTPKQYGGTNGFPFWFDWKPSDTIFVSSTGNDATGSGLAPNSPVRTIAKGLTLAKDSLPGTAGDQPRPDVAVSTGAFTGVVVDGSTFANYRTVTGGHDPATWKRAVPKSDGTNGTDVTGVTSSETTGWLVNGKVGQVIRQLDINSGAPGSAYNTYGLRATSSAGVILDYAEVKAQNGGSGAPAGNGTDPGPAPGNACTGVDGTPKSRSTTQARDGCASSGIRAMGTGGAGGGPGRFNGCGFLGLGWCEGGAGAPGGSGGGGASGGSAGGGGYCATPSPGEGQEGRGGVGASVAGTAGARGTTTVGDIYTGADGSPGLNGSSGAGGSGGGGGGGTYCAGGASGSSGPSGGEGGLPGAGGRGGLAGGGSFGVFSSLSTVKLSHAKITAGNGGNGGAGENGTKGANGGRGGGGAAQDKGGNSSGSGGGGGGSGGGGGQGGEAGPSIGVYSTGGLTPADAAGWAAAGVSVNAGNFGLPGARGSGGARGEAGAGGPGVDQTLFLFFTYDTDDGGSGTAGVAGSTPVDSTGAAGRKCAYWGGGSSCVVS